MKKKAIIFILLTVLLTSCSTRQAKNLEIPKESPVFNENDDMGTEKEQTDIFSDEETALEIESKTNMQLVTKSKIEIKSINGKKSWSTKDDILAQQVDDLINLQNEIFTAGISGLRDCDFDATITDSDGNKHIYQLWINFIKENEIIVKNESGELWNLSIDDSNRLRSILRTLS